MALSETGAAGLIGRRVGLALLARGEAMVGVTISTIMTIPR